MAAPRKKKKAQRADGNCRETSLPEHGFAGGSVFRFVRKKVCAGTPGGPKEASRRVGGGGLKKESGLRVRRSSPECCAQSPMGCEKEEERER